MNIRTIPFGYRYENGVPVIEDSEKETVMVIFNEYLNGKALREISDELTRKKIEFSPGKTVWNKARIMRIIDDSRYIGNSGYPPIINEDTYFALKKIKCDKNNQQEIDRTKGIYQLKIPVCCTECGSDMFRRRTKHHRCKEEWICKNSECNVRVKIEDEDLLEEIISCLNKVISDPEIVNIPNEELCCRRSEKLRLENEISRALEGSNIDKEDLRKKIFKRLSLQYEEICDEHYIAMHLKSILLRAKPLAEFSREFVSKTVDRILLNIQGKITLELKNHQKIQEVCANDDRSNTTATEGCSCDTCNRGDC